MLYVSLWVYSKACTRAISMQILRLYEAPSTYRIPFELVDVSSEMKEQCLSQV